MAAAAVIIIGALQQTLSPSTRQAAEAQLALLERTDAAFPVSLLQIIQEHTQDTVGISAVLYFKNFVTRLWNEENKVSEVSKQAMKQGGLLMRALSSLDGTVTSGPAQIIRDSLVEAIGIIASVDFPGNQWGDFVQQCLQLLVGEPNLGRALMAFLVLHRAFKRYRVETRSDELYVEINFVLQQVAPVLLEKYRVVSGGGSANEFRLLHAMNKFFFDLSAQDLPAFFEDNLSDFMVAFLAQIKCPSTDEAATKMKSSVLKIVTLYAERYEEDFPQLPSFIEAIWQHPRNGSEKLTASMLHLLSAVAAKERHRQLFASETTLSLLVQHFVLPNVAISEEEVELFEDEPAEFLRQEDDPTGRKTAAISLVRSTLSLNVTPIVLELVRKNLSLYDGDPRANWKCKLLAVNLFIAVAILGSTAARGVTRVNDMCDVGAFFRENVLPDLAPVNAALHPLVKIAALKWVLAFRHHLTREQLSLGLSFLLHHVQSHNVAIYGIAATTLERILATGIISKEDVRPMLPGLVTALNNRPLENEHVMRLWMRVILCGEASADISPILIPLEHVIRKNPAANPPFVHFLFETTAAYVRFGAIGVEKLLPLLEGALGVPELMPYGLQLLGAVIEFAPLALESLPVLRSLLQVESAGETLGALVYFVQACLHHFKGNMPAEDRIAVLRLYQRLIGSRATESQGFALLGAFFHWQPYDLTLYKPALMLILDRLRVAKSHPVLMTRLSVHSVHLLGAHFVPVHGVQRLQELFDAIQPGLLDNVASSVLAPAVGKCRQDRLIVIDSCLKLDQGPLFAACAAALMIDQGPVLVTEEDLEERSLTSSSSRLHSLPKLPPVEGSLALADVCRRALQSRFASVLPPAHLQFLKTMQ